MYRLEKSPPVAFPRSGMMRSSRNDFTTTPNATPMTKAIAISTRFPLTMKSRKSFHIWLTSEHSHPGNFPLPRQGVGDEDCSIKHGTIPPKFVHEERSL